MADVIKLTSRFTVAQFLAREDFARRFQANQPIAITELLYPLLQAYDSVMVESDVEFGGTDQKFNLLVGRDLQEAMGQRPQQCFLMPLLPGTDGVQKMSKSLGNYIGIDEPPNDMYGKTMSLPDELMMTYFECLTDVPDAELEDLSRGLEDHSLNPMDLKKKLAMELVTQFHTREAANKAADFFVSTIQRRELPDDMPTFDLPDQATLSSMKLSGLLVASGLAASNGDARRLISQGAVQIDGERVAEDGAAADVKAGSVLRSGRRRYVRLV